MPVLRGAAVIRACQEGSPADGTGRMDDGAVGGRVDAPATEIEVNVPPPPQLLIQDGELLVRVGGLAPVPLIRWLARWLARAERARCDRAGADRLISGRPEETTGDAANGEVTHGR